MEIKRCWYCRGHFKDNVSLLIHWLEVLDKKEEMHINRDREIYPHLNQLEDSIKNILYNMIDIIIKL